jgi:hypothetical protein
MMWKTIVDPGRAHMAIWFMHIAYWIPNTHSEYVIVVAFPLQQWSHEHTSMLRDMYFACLVYSVFLYSWVEGSLNNIYFLYSSINLHVSSVLHFQIGMLKSVVVVQKYTVFQHVIAQLHAYTA